MTSLTSIRTRRLALHASCVVCAAAGVASPAIADEDNGPTKLGKIVPAVPMGGQVVRIDGNSESFPVLAGGFVTEAVKSSDSMAVGVSERRNDTVDHTQSPAIHLLQPVVNGVAQSETIVVPILNGEIMLPEEFLIANAMTFDAEPFLLGSRRFIPAGALTAGEVGVELSGGRLIIECGVQCYRPHTVTRVRSDRGELSPVSFGGYANYEVFTEQGGRQDSLGTFTEAGMFSPYGTGMTHVSCTSLRDGNPCLRLDTSWTIDNPDNVQRMRIGDTITRAASWGAPARFGGLAWGTDFTLDPGFITFPVPTLAGESVLPGTVEVLINDRRRFSGDVEPGPFSITDVPIVTGAGTATVVVRDLLGRETAIDTAYYAAPQLLKQDLASYSVEAGFLRENYGLRSNDYGDPFVSGGYSRGVTDRVTLGVRSEVSNDRQTAGVSAAFLNPKVGVSEGSVALSSDENVGGALISVKHEYRSHDLTIGANVSYATEEFRGLGEIGPRAQLTSRAFMGFTMDKLGSANVNWTLRDEWNGKSFSSIGVGWSVPVKGVVLHLSAFQTIRPTEEFVGALRMTIPFGPGVASGSVEHRRGQPGARASYRVSPKTSGGLGYHVGASVDTVERAEAGIIYRNDVADMKLDFSQVDDEQAVRGTVRGGIASVGGRMLAARSISNSMAVIQVGEEDGVRVYVDRQLSGITDAEGKVLLTNLRAFENNRITFDPIDLGLETTFTAEAIEIRPGMRTGHVAAFDIVRGMNILLTIRDAEGEYLPLGSLVRDPGTGNKYPVGTGGRVYIENAQNVSQLVVDRSEDVCTVEVRVPVNAKPAAIVDAGEATCRAAMMLVVR